MPAPAAHGKPRERVLRFFRISSHRTVLVAGSTMRGEETAVLGAFKKIKATLRRASILAPRAPERFGEVERIARDAGFVTARRSELPIDAEPRADVIVLDSIGELAQIYQLATVVFVGGSLVDHGGHNILEPAIFGKPIVFGPHMQNFREIAETFIASGAAIQVASSGRDLDDAILGLVRDPVHRAGLGAAARRSSRPIAAPKRRRSPSSTTSCRRPVVPGATSVRSGWCTRFAAHAQHAIRRGGRMASQVVCAAPGAPAQARSSGHQRRQHPGRRDRQDAIVDCIARVLADAGYRPAVLLRGYGRKSPSSRPRSCPTDARWSPRSTRRRAADARARGFGRQRRRRRGSLRVWPPRRAQLNATVHILDDGFQHFHWRATSTRRDRRTRLSDEPLPHGRLREPLSSAASADAVLVDAGYQDAAERIGRALAFARVSHHRSLLPPRMVDSGDTVVVPKDHACSRSRHRAPERFFADLTSAGWDVVGTKPFRDHHRFTNGDISRVAAAAKKPAPRSC